LCAFLISHAVAYSAFLYLNTLIVFGEQYKLLPIASVITSDFRPWKCCGATPSRRNYTDQVEQQCIGVVWCEDHSFAIPHLGIPSCKSHTVGTSCSCGRMRNS
jgi:hypothetical protein